MEPDARYIHSLMVNSDPDGSAWELLLQHFEDEGARLRDIRMQAESRIEHRPPVVLKIQECLSNWIRESFPNSLWPPSHVYVITDDELRAICTGSPVIRKRNCG